jgi:hypothetical protein
MPLSRHPPMCQRQLRPVDQVNPQRRVCVCVLSAVCDAPTMRGGSLMLLICEQRVVSVMCVLSLDVMRAMCSGVAHWRL